jgi:hypothetical protein
MGFTWLSGFETEGRGSAVVTEYNCDRRHRMGSVVITIAERGKLRERAWLYYFV